MMQEKEKKNKNRKNGAISAAGPNFKRPLRNVEDEYSKAYKYTHPVKEYKHEKTKIRIT